MTQQLNSAPIKAEMSPGVTFPETSCCSGSSNCLRKAGLSILTFLVITAQLIQAQTDDKVWEKWDRETIARANTAAAVSYLTEEEKKVILFNNLARINGPLFAETFLASWLTDNQATRFSRSLAKDLKETKNLPLLYPAEDLSKMARAHAEKSGKQGTTGHQNFDKRSEEAFKTYDSFGENCAYGFESAFDNVVELLVDEGVNSLGHRKNMLNPEFNALGVSIMPHKSFRYNLVMNFGKLRE
jgi:uncharacterized protein YkwD